MRQQFSYTVEAQELGKCQVLIGTDPIVLEKQGKALGDTWQAEAALDQIKNILRAALDLEHKINWEKLKRKHPFPKLKPSEFTGSEPKPEDAKHLLRPNSIPEPKPDDAKYKPNLGFLDKLFKWRANKKIQAASEVYASEHTAWVEQAQIEAEGRRRANKLHLHVHAAWEKAKQESELAIETWNSEQVKFQQRQDANSAAIDKQKTDYESLQSNAITGYCDFVLLTSKYPDSFPKEFDLEYIPSTKILAIDYSLPSPDKMPSVKEVKYVKSRNEFHKTQLSETELNRIYDDALYQICLRTLHELFAADAVDALDAIVFNGWVRSIDRATGEEVNGCVISVQARKEEFQKINLARVDPKACFKSLKGIGSSTLHSLTPIAPVLKINRDDKRFVASHEVVDRLDERFNLAAMDWEDFEHLIRELFEREFSKSGSEVKVTQASRDGGVDAVVFDPDPIHGGKTIIQAKRYTNTVGVAAVRELYGTILNEGAMKGILVTTADYGPDAYEFAADKPLVLLNGGNLLSLLEKHGHKAKIDIKEAKRILGEKASVFHPF